MRNFGVMHNEKGRTLADCIYDELYQKITSGIYKEGQKLPTESEISQEYSVSRPVVRAALSELRTQGFIVSSRGVGSFVKRSRTFDLPEIRLNPVTELEDLKRCFEFRIALEGPMAAWAALNCNTKDKIEIQRAFDATESKYNQEDKTALNTDIAFHLAIAEATHNRFFPQAMQMIRIQIADGMEKIQRYFVGNKARHSSIKSLEHGLILEALLKRDPIMAQAAMELHLKRSVNWILPKKH